MTEDEGRVDEASPDDAGGPALARPIAGIVVALAPGFFEVAAGGRAYLCTLRGRLRKPRPAPPVPVAPRGGGRVVPIRGGRASARRPAAPATAVMAEDAGDEAAAARPARVAPGDRVLLTPLSETEGVIEDVLPRRTVLARARNEHRIEQVMLANLDVAVLVLATREPAPRFGLLDRYLALCEHAGVAPIICLNKLDLGVPPGIEEEIEGYAALGYSVLRTCATAGEGVAALRERLVGKISLLSGESGVGKSSLTNDLVPDARQRIGEVSQATGLGRHTTTGVRLLPLPGGGWLADSAGIRELSLWNVPPEELARCFVELRPFVGQCLYEDCTHGPDEEGCALRGALASGAIGPRRFASFERLLEEARAEEGPEWARR